MDKELIKEIIEYVERVEVSADKNWFMRDFEQLKEADEIPAFYHKLKEMLNA